MATISAVTNKCIEENMAKQIAKIEPIIKERCNKASEKLLERQQKADKEQAEKMAKEQKRLNDLKRRVGTDEAQRIADLEAQIKAVKEAARKKEADKRKAEAEAERIAKREGDKAGKEEERRRKEEERNAKKRAERAAANEKMEALRKQVNAKIKKYTDNIAELKAKGKEYASRYGLKSEKLQKVREAIATLEDKIKAVKADARSKGLHKFASPKVKTFKKSSSSRSSTKSLGNLIRKSSSSSKKGMTMAEMAPLRSVTRKTSPKTKAITMKSRQTSPEYEEVFEEYKESPAGDMTELVEMLEEPRSFKKSKSKSSESIPSF